MQPNIHALFQGIALKVPAPIGLQADALDEQRSLHLVDLAVEAFHDLVRGLARREGAER